MTLIAPIPTSCHDRHTIVQPVHCIGRLLVDSAALFIWFARQMPSFVTGLSCATLKRQAYIVASAEPDT
jgi:hypothetical protein